MKDFIKEGNFYQDTEEGKKVILYKPAVQLCIVTLKNHRIGGLVPGLDLDVMDDSQSHQLHCNLMTSGCFLYIFLQCPP